MRNWRVFSPLAFLLCAGPGALAQQAPPSDDLSELMALLDTPVVSASKSEQTIGQAPAKIVAITAEDIRRRGYQDLEEIFHDLAGMDFAKGRGIEWGTIFMRGMRTDNTDHFLVIWDGIIQNDTWKANVWLSRQYPILNIERIEVMYGPSSLLYGANAFGGIVNIILKKPKDVNGVAVQVGGGVFNTKWTEVNFGKEMGDWRFSANARYFRSDEMDMNDKTWTDAAGRTRYHNFVLSRDGRKDTTAAGVNGYAAGLKVDANGVPHWSVNGVNVPFDGRATGDTKDWWVQAGVGYKGFELQAYYWYKQEIEDNWYVPLRRMHGPWTPEGSAIYLSHEMPLGNMVSMKSYIRTLTSGLDGELSYDAGFSRSINNPNNPLDLTITSLGTVDYYDLSSREWRAGQQFNFAIPKANSVVGWEYTSSKNYEDYNLRRRTDLPWVYTPQHDDRNFGAFANTQVDPTSTLSLAAGFRYDYNYVAGEKGGFGHLYTGRMAAVLTPNQVHRFKFIYGQAFQAPSPWQKFATVVNDRIANPLLKPERMVSTEVVYEYAPVPKWRNSLSVYYNQITDQIALKTVEIGKDAGGAPILRNQQNNAGGLRIFGQELESRYFFDAKNSVYLNATFSTSKIPEIGLAQEGLADTKANIGADLLFLRSLSVNLRGHYMSDRAVPGAKLTSVPSASNLNWVKIGNDYFVASSAPTAGSYFTFDGVVTWLGAMQGLDVRLGIYNLFDKVYYDPGTRVPDGRGNNALLIQESRRVFLGLTYKF